MNNLAWTTVVIGVSFTGLLVGLWAWTSPWFTDYVAFPLSAAWERLSGVWRGRARYSPVETPGGPQNGSKGVDGWPWEAETVVPLRAEEFPVPTYPGAHAVIVVTGEDEPDVAHRIAALYVGYGWTDARVTARLGTDNDSRELDLGEVIAERTDQELRDMIEEGR